VPASADELWEKTLALLREDGKSYALTWLDRMQALEVKDGNLVLGVPDRFFRDWVDDHYRPLLEDAISRIHGGSMGIGYEVVGTSPSDASVSATSSGRSAASAPRPPRLNERFTFVNYVVAESNQLPAAAAAAVAESPGRAYNPLFIYGGTGLGKTHLLHAVGNAIFAKNTSARIVYLSSEEFTNEFVESVRDHKMTDFRRKFRDECDVLLIDDIQFLGKREETQKEFFYTFNALHEMSKAIVLTSDAVPAEIPGLEDRLRSRFTMGLITDIQEPNYETRVAILKKKAEADGFDLPDNVCHFIAKHVQKNVRELEGALIKISAVHSLTGQPVTEEFAAQVLRDILPAQRPNRHRSHPAGDGALLQGGGRGAARRSADQAALPRPSGRDVPGAEAHSQLLPGDRRSLQQGPLHRHLLGPEGRAAARGGRQRPQGAGRAGKQARAGVTPDSGSPGASHAEFTASTG
jgi:chromosomal replication initiator protein